MAGGLLAAVRFGPVRMSLGSEQRSSPSGPEVAAGGVLAASEDLEPTRRRADSRESEAFAYICCDCDDL